MIILPKYQNQVITSGLSHREFRCRCNYDSCRATLIDEDLVNSYHAFRILIAIPLKINSGYRCPLHNYDVGGVPDSWHTAGGAIDIGSRNLLTSLKSDEVMHLAMKSGFKYIKYYSSEEFFHMDTRS